MQEYFRKQELMCEGCGKPADCMHHYFPKSRAFSLRYYEPNLIAVCQGCHFAHHNGDPRLHHKVEQKRQLGWHEDLIKRKNEDIRPTKGYLESIIEKYSG